MVFETVVPEPLLYGEDNHISSQILLGKEVQPLRFLTVDTKTDAWSLTPNMMKYVERTGLQHLAEIKKCKIDHALLNALIERWRPETNTFHFDCGEITITLEDILYLYGLPIDGKAVTGNVWSNRNKLEDTCNRLLGVKLVPAAYLRGSQLSLNWIQEKFRNMPHKITAYDEIRYARAYLFCLVASQICTNNSGARGHAYILELFENFERYAWGPACLACLYRSMTRATQIKDRLNTITGPLQLLQIWAYSRTAVGRPLRSQLDEVCFDFPLFKMWRTVLKEQSFSSTTPERRYELGANALIQIEWQPYLKWTQKLSEVTNHGDMKICRSTAPLIYYWIIERHNCDRVYRQFGLLQPLPPPFHRWRRMDERASQNNVDYSSRNQIYVDAWEGRERTVIGGVAMEKSNEQCAVQGLHRRFDSALKKVDQFLQWQVGSIDSISIHENIDVLQHSAMLMGRKTAEFRAAITSLEALEKFDLEGFIDRDTSSETTSNGSRPQPIEGPINCASPKISEREHGLGIHSCSRIKTTGRSARRSRHTDERKRKARVDHAAQGLAKRRGKNDQLPLIISPYPSASRKGDPLPNPEYALSTDEQRLLDTFWEKFNTSPDTLNGQCSYISANELHQILEMHWISTTIMDYWLAITTKHLQGTHIFPSTLASWRDRRWNQCCTESFNICYCRRLDELQTLIFPVWYLSHFFLLVAYPADQRWEYYNTMGWRKRQWEYAREFKGFVCTQFESGGWHGIANWDMQIACNCPRQDNSNDCGVFVMAIADHLARGRALTFSQADMWFFRRKIVHDMYKEQLLSHEARDGGPTSSHTG